MPPEHEDTKTNQFNASDHEVPGLSYCFGVFVTEE